jgi:S-formylglutathione hydrolase FrmB
LKIGLANPEKYAAIGCLSAGMINRGANTPLRQARMQLLYGDRELAGTEEDPFGNAQRILDEGRPVPRIYHACGDDDFLLASAHETRDFFRSFAGNPFDYTYEQNPGVHSWEFWDEHIQHFLRFLNLMPEGEVRN